MFADDLAALFSRDLTRLRQQLDAFPDEASLWLTAPGITNSAGTLALHLEGNLREYVWRQLGGHAYVRDRPAEFSTRSVPRAALVRRVTQLATDIPRVLSSMPAEVLQQPYPEHVLGIQTTTAQLLVHLHGHLNYHLGQIDYARRLLTGTGAIELIGLVQPDP
jgi:hypothetical protein